MPHPKLVYQGLDTHGTPEWLPAQATWAACAHPHHRLRFDGSFGLPSYLYCRDCGLRWIGIDGTPCKPAPPEGGS